MTFTRIRTHNLLSGSVASGTLGAASEWTQIGDNITVSGGSSMLKSIATTGLSWVGATVTPATGSDNITYAMLVQA